MRRWCAVCACALPVAVVEAKTYSVKPVRIINPFSPGGSLDLVARLLARSLSGDLGQQFIVENRAGAGFDARLNELTRKNIAHAESKSVMDAQGLDGATGTPAELAALVKAEWVKWARVVKVADIKPE